MAHSTMPVLTETTAREIAGELVVLGFALLLMDTVRRAHPIAGSRFLGLPTHADAPSRSFGFEDPHTVVSSAIADLTRGPVVLCLPDSKGRHLSVTLIDSAGEAFASIGSRTHEAGGCDITLVGPGFKGEVAGGFRACRAHSDTVWLVSRIQAHGLADMAAARGLAARQALVHAGVHTFPEGEPAFGQLEAPDLLLEKRLAGTPAKSLLHRLGPLVAQAPRAQRARLETEILPRLARLGPPDAWSGPVQEAVAQGVRDSLGGIAAAADGQAAQAGWRRLSPPASSPPQSAASAAELLSGLGAAREPDILALLCATDESGRPLRGDEHYRLGFEAAGPPPAQYGWRLSAQPSPGARPPDEGVIGRVGFGADAAATTEILIGSARQEPAVSSSVIAPPGGRFALSLRLYGPHAAALRNDWRPPPVERLGSRPGAPS
ncbi:DUF1254 domain-containing protein [Phenylobacterium terrae]|uniref:DUF1254 domain-containing protein n=1 Tax=Phenylobacterium terrae TaxID=2665495 RepID=A0ABW4N2F9_9CAUL